jgi:hypothetical protein
MRCYNAAHRRIPSSQMDENPYPSPPFNQPAEKRDLLPLWRRMVSSVLLFFGIGYLCCVPVAAIVPGLYAYWIQRLTCAMLYLVLGVALGCGCAGRRPATLNHAPPARRGDDQ